MVDVNVPSALIVVAAVNIASHTASAEQLLPMVNS
jgi:hypothetical protein